MNDDFDNIAFIPNQIAEQAFQKGVKEGKAKVDANIYNDSYIKGWNKGAIVGMIESQISILKIIDPTLQTQKYEEQLKHFEQVEDLINLRKALTKLYPLKGLIQLKKQSLDF
ncbi:unnamed protein product [Paramecium primaurelia]|uniref:Uncharacterized protein n=1 Tax=Paramecium primaurelia TaxID=5886 RepID=A0A8S1KWV7_PARPR|nr:unnamed protein product [Paramecium primaurelia]